MYSTKQQITTSLNALLLTAAIMSLSGCASVRSMICDCDKTCGDEPTYCDSCSGIASCAAPMGMQGTPYMGEMPNQNMGPIVPMPMPDGQMPATGAQSEAEQWAPQATWLPPAQQQQMNMSSDATAQATAACEVQLQKARQEFDAKLNALEARFESERQAKSSLHASLDTVNGEVSRLSREIEFWRDEVRRIDRTTEMQHQSDMASLSSISKMIDNIAPASASSTR